MKLDGYSTEQFERYFTEQASIHHHIIIEPSKSTCHVNVIYTVWRDSNTTCLIFLHELFVEQLEADALTANLELAKYGFSTNSFGWPESPETPACSSADQFSETGAHAAATNPQCGAPHCDCPAAVPSTINSANNNPSGNAAGQSVLVALFVPLAMFMFGTVLNWSIWTLVTNPVIISAHRWIDQFTMSIFFTQITVRDSVHILNPFWTYFTNFIPDE